MEGVNGKKGAAAEDCKDKEFTMDEVIAFLQVLQAKNKVMVDKGNVYMISNL